MLLQSWLSALRRRPFWLRGRARTSSGARRSARHRLHSSLLRFYPLRRSRRGGRRRVLNSPKRRLFSLEALESRVIPGDAMASGILATSLAKGSPPDPTPKPESENSASNSSGTKTATSGQNANTASTNSGTTTTGGTPSSPVGTSGSPSPQAAVPPVKSTGTETTVGQSGGLIPSLPASLESGSDSSTNHTPSDGGRAPEPSAPPATPSSGGGGGGGGGAGTDSGIS